MKKTTRNLSLTKLNILIWGIVAISLIVGIVYVSKRIERPELTVEKNEEIDATPTIITAMKEIGEWEFLSVDDEEIVDTVRKGFFSDDKLVRIYYGKLSLGLNMHKARPQWISKSGDSTIVNLPPIELLDNDFIDEAKSRAFIESGKWTDSDRNALYHKAYEKMLHRAMTDTNIRLAQQNAEVQFGNILKSLGIERYEIRWK